MTKTEAREKLLAEIEEKAGPFAAHSLQGAIDLFEHVVEREARLEEHIRVLGRMREALDRV